MRPNEMTRPQKWGYALGLLLLTATAWGGWIWTHSEWIEPGEVGIIYNSVGGMDRTRILGPGRYYIGIRQRLYRYPTRLKAAVYTQDPNEGENKSADGIQVTTKDTANTTFDVTVFYRVDKNDVFTAFDTFGPISIEEVQRNHLRRALKDVVNQIGVQYEIFPLIGAKREEANLKLTSALKQRMRDKGITISKAFFGRPYPGESIVTKINARVNSLTELAISDLRRQTAGKLKEIAVVRARSLTQAQRLKSAATTARSEEMLELDAEEEAVDAWDGRPSPYQAKPGTNIVITGEALREYYQIPVAQPSGNQSQQGQQESQTNETNQ